MASTLNTPTAVAASSHTFTVSAGTDRALIVALTGEGTQSGQHTCTYGGETMQFVVESIAGSGTTQQTVSLFFLNDAGIAAASGTTITPGNVPSDLSIHAASYQNCVQTTPSNTDTDTSGGATPNPLAACDIVTGAANAMVCAISGMGNAGSAAWGGTLTERTDQATASANGSYADDAVPSATTIACDCTWTTPNRAAIAALELAHLEPSSVDQEGFRWYDDGTEAGSVARQAQDTADTVAKALTVQLRVLLDATGDPASAQYQLEYKETSDPAAEWRPVPLT